MATVDELQSRFASFANETRTRAPLYARLSNLVADDADMASILLRAPQGQQVPVLLFAAIHDLLLAGYGPALAAWYPNLAEPDGAPEGDLEHRFRGFVLEQATAIGDLVATRNTQTNEVGRCALLLVALAIVAREVGSISLVDVGTSAGLNLLLDQYAYEYDVERRGSERHGSEPRRVVVGGPSSVTVACGVRGDVALPESIPDVRAAIGIDHAPIDVDDDGAVRWLEACVWPDQLDRFARLQAAITLARQHPPDVRVGDALSDLAAVVGEAADSAHPVVMNSWVLSYFSVDEQRAYVDVLDHLGANRDLSWVAAESPAQTPGLSIPTITDPEHRTVLSLIRWRHGRRTIERIGTVHPHGFWLHADPSADQESPR